MDRKLPNLSSAPERLKFAREKVVKLNQAQVAEALSMSTKALGNMERGTRRIHERDFVVLAEFYGVSLEWLRDGVVPASDGDGSSLADLRGKCLLDIGLYEKVMAADSLAQLRQLLPSSSLGFRVTVSSPISESCIVVDWAEAQARQQQLEQKVRQLIAEEFAMHPSPQPDDGSPVAFDSTLARACEEACRTEDQELARRCMNWSPYFLDLIHIADEDDVEFLPRDDAIDAAFNRMRQFERTFPGLVLEWRRKHDIGS